METFDNAIISQSELELFHTSFDGSRPRMIIQAVEVTARDFHDNHDLFLLQKRCEVLSRLLEHNEQERAVLEWIATQAELIDCGLVSDSPASLETALSDLRLC